MKSKDVRFPLVLLCVFVMLCLASASASALKLTV